MQWGWSPEIYIKVYKRPVACTNRKSNTKFSIECTSNITLQHNTLKVSKCRTVRNYSDIVNDRSYQQSPSKYELTNKAQTWNITVHNKRHSRQFNQANMQQVCIHVHPTPFCGQPAIMLLLRNSTIISQYVCHLTIFHFNTRSTFGSPQIAKANTYLSTQPSVMSTVYLGKYSY